jgi:integrase
MLPDGWGKAIEGFVVSLEKQGYSPYTIRDYRVDVARLAQRFPLSPGQIDLHHVLKAADDLKREGLPLTYQRRRVAAWQRFRTWLHHPKNESLSVRVLNACTLEPLADQVLVASIAYAALRPCELIALEGRDIRMKHETITARVGLRIIPIHPTLMQLLIRYRAEFPLPPYRPLLPGPNGFPVNTRTLHARFRRLCTRIGMPELSPENLRRDTAGLLRMMGTPPGLIRAVLGRDKGRTCSPRRGPLNDLSSSRLRLRQLPGPTTEEAVARPEKRVQLL